MASLQTVDSVDATILVDNSIDILLPSADHVIRPSLTWDWSRRPQLRAEHGYSLLFNVQKRGSVKTILYDAGLSPDTITHNLAVLGIKLTDLDAIVLSHGHADHHGGLFGIVHSLGKKNLPLILHPDAWKNRKIRFPSGSEMHMPPPDRRALEKNDVRIIDSRAPSLLLSDQALVTGQVERVTDYEKGFPLQYEEKELEHWESDPWIWDDQGIVFNVNGRGLVVASSCSHSGAVNVLRNAQRITGANKVHAFIGGMHLTGGTFEKIIPQTIQDVKTIHPDIIVPGHCTGWKATHLLSREMPDAYVQASVGTQIHFG
ncbi:MBL fold metallo-hydrolase [Candidatus Bathyarchaeota archaeon]|nr:MAG: MBL fold metallo-hydrolase [Candidatus Bathyarchaeota archaeon]TMI60685.1 MAG: MBL fold metallo-hydrolase [Candidatus Bathyarchaeota archaeon]